MALDVDMSQLRTLQISEGAFECLYFGEGQGSYEVDDINEEYELGFLITDYEYIGNYVEIKIAPYINSDFEVDTIIAMFNGWTIECECDRVNKIVRYRYVHLTKGADEILESRLQKNGHGNEYFLTGEFQDEFVSGYHSMYFLQGPRVTKIKSRT